VYHSSVVKVETDVNARGLRLWFAVSSAHVKAAARTDLQTFDQLTIHASAIAAQ
jgi:hypothetical protein